MIDEPMAGVPDVHVVNVEQDAKTSASCQDWEDLRREMVSEEGDLADELENLMARALRNGRAVAAIAPASVAARTSSTG